jgi:hypothetical protein
MAKHAVPKTGMQEGMQLVGIDDIDLTFADTFAVVTENETRLSTLYFFQSQPDLPTSTMADGTRQFPRRKTAKCVGRILIAETGISQLAKALVENRIAIEELKQKGSENKQ